MTRIPKPMLIGAVAVAALVGVVILSTSDNRHHQVAKATYYCPMHPTYTSDRPGDCPICSMKLVKREEPTGGAPQPDAAKRMRDICYMHNCPLVHAGKPCPMLVVAKEGERVTCPICGTHVAGPRIASGARKVLYWTDPMIPGFTSDTPGKSPMGMDLVPVYEEAAPGPMPSPTVEGYAPILVSPQKQQFIGIKTARVERRQLTKTIRTAGTIAHDPELYQAQAEYIQAIQALAQARQGADPEVVDQAQRLVDSTRIRLKHLGLSDELIQEIATWNEPEHSLLFTHPGEPVWVYAQVYEYELPLIHLGQELTVEVPAFPGPVFRGTIRAIDPMVEPMTRTTRVRAQLQDPHGQLKPDMFVNVAIAVDLGEVIAIPEEAVFDTGTKQLVFLDKGQGLFEPRDVTVGAKADAWYVVHSGLVEGESVVTSGNFLIDSESRLKAALQGFTSTNGSPQGTEHAEGMEDGGHHHGR